MSDGLCFHADFSKCSLKKLLDDIRFYQKMSHVINLEVVEGELTRRILALPQLPKSTYDPQGGAFKWLAVPAPKDEALATERAKSAYLAAELRKVQIQYLELLEQGQEFSNEVSRIKASTNDDLPTATVTKK